MNESWMHIVKGKKLVWERYIVYNSNYMILWKRQNYDNGKKDFQEFGGGEESWIDEALGISRTVKVFWMIQ